MTSCGHFAVLPDPGYKGSKYNITVEWENGEITYEPLFISTAKNNPITCLIYAREKGLLDIYGRKQFKTLAK